MRTSQRRPALASVAMALAVAFVVAACGSDTSTTSVTATGTTQPLTQAIDKSGAPIKAATLTLVTDEPTERPGGVIVTRFVEEVAKLSGGAITVDPTFAGRGDSPAWDQRSIEAVLDGEYDLVYARAGAWESEGVETVSPLQLPGVIGSDDQADRVAQAPVAGDILAGLDKVGAIGLGLYPENLRHFALWGTDPASADTIKGRRIRVPLQPTVYRWLEAAGAVPVDLGNEFYDQVADGTLTAMDISFVLGGLVLNSGPDTNATVTGNLVMYAKFGTLAIGAEQAATLGEDGMAILRAAAAQVLADTVATRPHEPELSQASCSLGVRIATASDDAIASVLAAAQPIIDEVAADPVAGPILTGVRAAAGEPTPTALPDCAGAVAADDAAMLPSAGELPNGVYRVDVNDEILAQYLPEYEWEANRGVYTWTMQDGHYSWTIDWPKYPPVNDGFWYSQAGSYRVDGDLLTIQLTFVEERDQPYLLTAHWSLNADQSLSLEWESGSPRWKDFEKVLIAPRWERIGDA